MPRKRPKTKRTSAPARRRSTTRKKQPKRRAKPADACHVFQLNGEAVELVYRAGGQTFRHRFGPGVKLYASRDLGTLLVKGGEFKLGLYLED